MEQTSDMGPSHFVQDRQSRLQENEWKTQQKTNTSAEWWDEPKDKPRQLRSQAVSQYLEDTWDCVGLLASQLFTTDGFLQQWNETRHESCVCHRDSMAIPPATGTPRAAHLESNEDTGFSTELLLSQGFFPESEKKPWKVIVFALKIKIPWKLIVLYSCFHSVRMSDLGRARKMGLLNECSSLHYWESIGKNLLSDPFN